MNNSIKDFFSLFLTWLLNALFYVQLVPPPPQKKSPTILSLSGHREKRKIEIIIQLIFFILLLNNLKTVTIRKLYETLKFSVQTFNFDIIFGFSVKFIII